MRFVIVPEDIDIIDRASGRNLGKCSCYMSVRLCLASAQQRPVVPGVPRMPQRGLEEIEQKFKGTLPGDVVPMNDNEHALVLEEFDVANPAVVTSAWAWSMPPHRAAFETAAKEKPASQANGKVEAQPS